MRNNNYHFKPFNTKWLHIATDNQAFVDERRELQEKGGFNVKYHKEIMEDQKRPLWLVQLRSHRMVFQASVSINGGSSRQIGTVLGQVSGRKLRLQR